MKTAESSTYVACVAALAVLGTAFVVFLFSVAPNDISQLLSLPVLFLFALGLTLVRVNTANPSLVLRTLALVALAVFVTATAIQIPNRDYPGLWAGFGVLPTAAALGLAVTIVYGPVTSKFLLGTGVRRLLFGIVIPLAVVFPRLTLFIQPPNGLINLGDTTYHVLDELLAPYNFKMPYGNYTPQYTGVLGWLVFPLRFLPISGEGVMAITVVIANLLNLAVPLLVVAISKRVLPAAPRVLVFSMFVAVYTVCGSDLGYSVQIREFAQFARFVPTLFTIWLILRLFSRTPSARREVRARVAGFGLALSILNGVDHGLTLAAAVGVSLLLLARRGRIASQLVIQLALTALVVLVTYMTVIYLLGQPPSLQSYLGLRSDALDGGVYGAGRISPLGPHVIVLALPVILIALSINQRRAEEPDSQAPVIEFLSLTIGLWILALFVKFLLKDPAGAVEIPTLIVPSFIGGVLLCNSIGFHAVRDSVGGQRLMALPIAFLVSLSLGGIYPSMNVSVRDELKRISGRYLNTNDWSSTPGRNVDGWSPKGLVVENNFLVEIPRMSAPYLEAGRSLGYFGVFGNTVEAVTKVRNLTGIPAPESLRFGDSQRQLACVPVERAKVDIIIVFDTELPCRGYAKVRSEFGERFSVYQRIP